MGSASRRALVIVTGGVAGLMLALVHAACGANVFACSANDECSDGGEAGTCEASGYCSFPDPECESGSRYGDHAGDSLAGDCVPPDAGTTGTADDDGSPTTADVDDSLEDSSAADVVTDPTIDPTTVDSTTDTPLPECGDGNLDPGEICDDDNLVDGDGCNADCSPSGTVLWEIVEDGGAGLADGAASIAIDDADALFVGAWFTTGMTPRLAARRLALDGTIEWTTPIVGPLPWNSIYAWGIEVDAAGNPAIAGDGSTGMGDDWVVAQLDAEGEILWQAIEPGEAYGLGIGESVWVCGQGPSGQGMLIGYDDLGVDTHRLLGAPAYPADGFAWDCFVTDNQISLAGTIASAPERGFLRRVDSAGTVNASHELEASYDQGLALAQGQDSWWFVGRSNTLDAGWIAQADASFDSLVGPTIATEDGVSANLHGVTVGPSGEVVAVGWQTVDEGYDALVQKYSPAGELAWSRTFASPDDLDGYARDAVIASDGTIVFAGHAGQLNDTGDFWVVALTP